jgi:hypothetical protein
LREKLLLLLAALAAFGGCLGAPFQFDDFALFTDPAITSPSGWSECWRINQTRPLTWFTFWINYQLGHHNPAGYHAVNLALHLGVVLLTWEVLRVVIPAQAALAAAALFAVHPILTEPVAYVFARGTLLAAMFSLLSIRSWLQGRHWWAVGWFAIAMLAKEECAALPVFLLVLGRPRNLGAIGAMFGIALAAGLRAVWATTVTAGSGAGAHAGISPVAYLVAQGPAVLRYLRLFVVPWGFSVDPQVSTAYAWLAWLIVIALAAAACFQFDKTRAGFWFLAGLVLLAPSSSIFPAADLAADRRMYLPMVAFCACAALMLDRRLVMALVVILAAISFHYTSLWRDPEALWSEAVEQAPNKLRPRLQFARALPPERALRVLEEAQRLAPGDPEVATDQGRTLLALGRPGEALEAFGRALGLDPNDARALNNRGAALSALGQPDAARADYERALSKDPCLFDARLNLLRMGVRTAAPQGCRYTPEERAMLSN